MSPALSGPYPIPQGTAGTMGGTLFDANDQPVPLTLATDVRLGIEPASPALPIAPRMLDLRVPTDEGVGRFAWDYEADDVDVPGLYRAQVHMLMPDGPKSFPSDGYLDISVIPQAGIHPASPPPTPMARLIPGPQGPEGPVGPMGPSGDFTWQGHGPPDPSQLPGSKPGDDYIDVDTGDVYRLD